MSASADDRENEFHEIISELATTSHGSGALHRLQDFFRDKVRKTQQREAFLLQRLTRNPIIWEDVKSEVWESEHEQEVNNFPFLQGDVIQSNHVLELGDVFSAGNLWIVLAADCDCARANYIRVGRLYSVFNEKPKDKNDVDFNDFNNSFSQALTFRNSKLFPIPPLPSGCGTRQADPDVRRSVAEHAGRFANDLEQLYGSRSPGICGH